MHHSLRTLALLAATTVIVSTTPAHARDGFEWGDPLGFSPLDLSGKLGVLWGTLAVTTSLLIADDSPKSQRAPRDQFYFTSRAEWYQSIHEDETDVWSGRLGGGAYARRWLSVGGELHATGARDSRIRTVGSGGLVLARFHFIQTRPVSVFFEQGIGMILFKQPFPPGGSKLDFTPMYGLGVLIHFYDEIYSYIGVRHLHISNAGLFGEGNPGFDSNGVSLGFELR
jgi:hypothetical protein